MALGDRGPKQQPLGIWAMAIALVVSAFLGAAIGLVWQSSDWLSEEPEEEVLTKQKAPG